MDAEDEGDMILNLRVLGVVLDLGFPNISLISAHVNSFQFEQLFTQDEMIDSILLISRSILTDA